MGVRTLSEGKPKGEEGEVGGKPKGRKEAEDGRRYGMG